MSSPVAITFIYNGSMPSDYMVELLTDLLVKNVVTPHSHVTVKVADAESIASLVQDTVVKEVKVECDAPQRPAHNVAIENALTYIGTRFKRELKSTSQVNAFVISVMNAIADHRVAQAHGKEGDPELITALNILKDVTWAVIARDVVLRNKMKEYNMAGSILNAIKDII